METTLTNSASATMTDEAAPLSKKWGPAIGMYTMLLTALVVTILTVGGIGCLALSLFSKKLRKRWKLWVGMSLAGSAGIFGIRRVWGDN